MFYATQRQQKIFLIIICCCFNLIAGGLDQRRLLKYLLTDSGYNPIERPVANDSDTLPVTINLALQHIINFDGKNEAITISGWMTLMWNDYGLRWKPEEYGNIQTLRIPSTQIWIPDILLYNSADEKFDVTMKVNAVVQYNGDVLYVPPILLKSICPFNIAAFPFVRVNLTTESNQGQLDAYVKSAEWDLEDFSATNNSTTYDCCPTVYPYVLYTIRMRRRSLYYFTNIVLPCFLISCMTLLGFLLAPESGEKLTLQITILLSVVMFSLLMSEIMPPSSTAIPLITMYFICVMCMSTLSVVASVLVISLHFRSAKNYSMPTWVRKYICYYLAWLLCMKRPHHDLSWNAIRRKWATQKHRTDSINVNGSVGNQHLKVPSAPLLQNKKFELLPNNIINVENESSESFDDQEKQRSNSFSEASTPSPENLHRASYHPNLSIDFCSQSTEMIRAELRVIVSQLATLTRLAKREEYYDDEVQDWQFVGMVVDRLCLILFTISMTIFTTLTFINI